MRTRSSSNLVGESSPNPTTSNPKRRNRRRSKQPFNLEEPLENQAPPVVTMADQRTMAELLRAPTEGYAEAIVVPPILAEHFELKHSLINMMTSDQFFGLEKDNPHDHIRWFNKITSTIKYKDVPNSAIKLMLFPFSLAGAARRWLEKEPPRSILTWEDLVSKFINEFFPPSKTTNLRNEISNFEQHFGESFHESWDRYKDLLRACPHHGFTKLHQLDTFYNALNPTDQDSLNYAAGGNLLERSTRDVLTIIENKSKCMRTCFSSNLVGESSPNLTTSNSKRCNRKRSKQPFSLEKSPVVTMADQRTMAELLRAPTEGYAEAIVFPPILAEHFKLKHSLINMMTSDQFFRLEKDNPHDHIPYRWLEKEPPRSILTWEDLVSKFINEFFPPSRTTNLRNEISNFEQRFGESFHKAWDRNKDLLRVCPHHGFTELHQFDTFYNALNPTDQDSLNSAAGGNLLEISTQDVLTIIKNKSKIAKLTHAVNQQTSAVTTVMTAILKQFQATPPLAFVKAVEEIYVTGGGAHPYYQCLAADGNTFLDNIKGYVSAAMVNYNQGNSGYRPPSVANQIRPPGFAQPNVQNNQNRFSQPQGYN
ncbi:reverse transcriptase domain-containing protein [Tanacetum coccineum]